MNPHHYTGDISQIFGVTDYICNDGKAKGTRAFDLRSDTLCATILADRCMDIARLSYKGVNLGYMANCGIVAPQYFAECDNGFMRGFYAGFLTTCGLSNAGAKCESGGIAYGAHGRIGNTPAQSAHYTIEYDGDVPTARLFGTMHEGELFGVNLTLSREIIYRMGDNALYIKDVVRNNGYKAVPLMLLYHFNLGYPLLSDNATFVCDSTVVPRDSDAATGIDTYAQMHAPISGYREQVFYHDAAASAEGIVTAALQNSDIGLSLAITYNKAELPRLTQWKQLGVGEYVHGIEPANCHVEGRAKAEADGSLQYIEAGQSLPFGIQISVNNI